MRPEVTFQPEASRYLQAGVRQIVDTVAPTLGPSSRQVVYSVGNGKVEFLDDGGSIARRIIQLPDRNMDMGAMYVRHVLWNVRERVGDGVATAAVVFKELLDEGLKLVAAGANPVRLRLHLEQGVELILAGLDSQTQPIKGRRALAGVAETICHDKELAKILGEIFEIVGPYGRVETRKAMGRSLSHEYVEGSYWPGSTHSAPLIKAAPGKKLEFADAALLLTNLSIGTELDLARLADLAKRSEVESLIVFAKDVSDSLLGAIHSERFGPRLQVVPVKLPSTDSRVVNEFMVDLGVASGGTSLLAEAGDALERATVGHLGYVRRFWVDADHFGVAGPKGDPVARRKRLAQLQAAHGRATDDRKRLLTQIGRALGGTAVVHVGGATEVEVSTRQAVLDRSVRVLRGATAKGAVPGGGSALLRCRDALKEAAANAEEFEEQVAYQALARAVEAPVRQLARNAACDEDIIVGGIVERGSDVAFDLRTRKYSNCLDSGLMDVAEVQRHAVQQAVHGVGLLLTAEVLVGHRSPEEVFKP